MKIKISLKFWSGSSSEIIASNVLISMVLNTLFLLVVECFGPGTIFANFMLYLSCRFEIAEKSENRGGVMRNSVRKAQGPLKNYVTRRGEEGGCKSVTIRRWDSMKRDVTKQLASMYSFCLKYAEKCL